MNELNLQEILKESVLIPSNRHYWLVRTMGGDFYPDYYRNNFIAIGYDLISLKDISIAKAQGDNAQKYLSERVFKRYEKTDSHKEINPGYAAAQLLRFSVAIKEGDVVLVPGRSNERKIGIGIVAGEPYEEIRKTDPENKECPFRKRIKVIWCDEFDRYKLNPQLQLIFNSRHIVSNVDNYAQLIDNCIFDFYRKEDQTYLVLSVKTQKDIPGNDFMFIGDVLSLLSDFIEENHLNLNVDDIRMKACVQSPGDIIMFAKSAEGICLFGLIILLLNGGKFQLEKFGLELSTKGILQHLSEFLDRRRDRKVTKALCKKLENLDIDNPDDLLQAIKQIKSPRDKY